MIQRYSKKRQAIIDCLMNTTTHPTADWIHRQLSPQYPDLSLGTVYRNLSQLKEAGVMQSIGVVNGHERFDYNTAPHTHMICNDCGSVSDVMGVELPESLINAAQAATGCSISGASLMLSGTCRCCRRDEITN